VTTEPHNDRCIICRGTRQEHNDSTRHAFTLTPGDLRPPEPPKQPPRTVLMPGGSTGVVERLLELLMEKGIISDKEALRCLGIRAEGLAGLQTRLSDADMTTSGGTPSGSGQFAQRNPSLGEDL